MGDPDALSLLARRLEEISAGYHTRQEQAKELGISAQTLAQILARRPEEPRSHAANEPASISQKRQIGLSQSISRVVAYVNERGGDPIDLNEVISAMGLNPSSLAVQKGIRSAAVSGARAKGKTLRGAPLVDSDDAILRGIIERSNIPDSNKGPIRVGVVKWPPWLSVDPSSAVEQRPNKPGSLGYRLAQSWLGCINPNWGVEFSGEVVSFSKLGARLAAQSGGDSELDAVIGVYDTPFRRLNGMDFVTLPGIGMPLGVVTTKRGLLSLWGALKREDDPLASRDVWSTFQLDPKAVQRLFSITVVQDEIGDLFASGPCNLDRPIYTNVEYVREPTFKAAIGRFVAELNGLGAEGGEARGGSSREPMIIADRALCEAVIKTATRERPSAELVSFSRLDHPLGEAPGELSEYIGNSLNFAPTYAVGIGVSSTATKFKKYIKRALYMEFIGNASALAANSYSEILLQSPEFDVIELPNKMSNLQRRRLAQSTIRAIMARMMSKSSGADSGLGEKRIKQINDTWLEPFQGSNDHLETSV